MKNPLNYLANKRLRIKRWLVSGMLFSIGATFLTYYSLGVINRQTTEPVFIELIATQEWLMRMLGMENWLMMRMGIYGLAFLTIKHFPTKLYERNQLFRYATNLFAITLAIAFTMDFLNDFMALLDYLL